MWSKKCIFSVFLFKNGCINAFESGGVGLGENTVGWGVGGWEYSGVGVGAWEYSGVGVWVGGSTVRWGVWVGVQWGGGGCWPLP